MNIWYVLYAVFTIMQHLTYILNIFQAKFAVGLRIS